MNVYGGVDIGGTSVKFAVTDGAGTILYESSFATDTEKTEFSQAMERISDWMKKTCETNKFSLQGIGIGCTGPINTLSGVIENPYTLPGWVDNSLTNALFLLTGIPVLVENDGNTALYGELSALNFSSENLAMLTFGTGVGLSIYLGGDFYRLPSGFHPEAGHLSVGTDSSFTCYCGKKGCLENILSGTAVNRDAKYYFNKSPEEILQSPESEEGKFFINRMADTLEEVVANIAVFFHSEIVILGGGIQKILVDSVAKIVQERLDKLENIHGRTRMVPAVLEKNAGIIGGALLIKKYLQEKDG